MAVERGRHAFFGQEKLLRMPIKAALSAVNYGVRLLLPSTVRGAIQQEAEITSMTESLSSCENAYAIYM